MVTVTPQVLRVHDPDIARCMSCPWWSPVVDRQCPIVPDRLSPRAELGRVGLLHSVSNQGRGESVASMWRSDLGGALPPWGGHQDMEVFCCDTFQYQTQIGLPHRQAS